MNLAMNFRKVFERISNKLYQKDLKDLDENSLGIIEERSSMGKKLIGSLIVACGIAVAGIAGKFIYDAWKNRDSDGDGIPDEIEKNYGTDPFKKDSDNDGIDDYKEIFVYKTDPLKPNPNVKQALDLGLEKYIDVVKPLDNDGIQDKNEKEFVELMANNKKFLIYQHSLII